MKTKQFQWFLVIMYIVVWDWVLVSIVQGQIVDAYANIRQKTEYLELDARQRCLVCSLEKTVIDSVPETDGFHQHVTAQHNPLLYLFWMYYLGLKEDDDESGMEHYTSKLIDIDNEGWIPIMACQAMQMSAQDDTDREQDVRSLLENLPQNIVDLLRQEQG